MKKLTVVQVSESDFSVKAHGVHTAYIEMAGSLAKRSDVKLVKNSFKTKADIRHIHTIGPYSLMHLLFGSGKKVVSVHVIPESFIGSLAGAKFWLPLARLYLKWFYGRADRLFAVSGTVARVLKDDMKVRVPIEVFYNTVDMKSYHGSTEKRLAARKKFGYTAEDFVVIGNGQVQPRKRLDTFYQTAEMQSTMQFVWIGGIPFKQLGADYADMKHIMEDHPKNVRVTGVIDHSEVYEYLYAADAFFLPAEQENHPMCVLEAAGAGLPVLLRDMPEYDDTFRGDAYMMTSPSEAATELGRLQSDAAYYTRRQVETKRIAEKFDSAKGAERAVAIYRSMLEKRLV